MCRLFRLLQQVWVQLQLSAVAICLSQLILVGPFSFITQGSPLTLLLQSQTGQWVRDNDQLTFFTLWRRSDESLVVYSLERLHSSLCGMVHPKAPAPCTLYAGNIISRSGCLVGSHHWHVIEVDIIIACLGVSPSLEMELIFKTLIWMPTDDRRLTHLVDCLVTRVFTSKVLVYSGILVCWKHEWRGVIILSSHAPWGYSHAADVVNSMMSVVLNMLPIVHHGHDSWVCGCVQVVPSAAIGTDIVAMLDRFALPNDASGSLWEGWLLLTIGTFILRRQGCIFTWMPTGWFIHGIVFVNGRDDRFPPCNALCFFSFS